MNGLRPLVLLLVLALVGGTGAVMAMPLCPMRAESAAPMPSSHPCCPKQGERGGAAPERHQAPADRGGAQVSCCLPGTASVLPVRMATPVQGYVPAAYVAATVAAPRDPFQEPMTPPPKRSQRCV